MLRRVAVAGLLSLFSLGLGAGCKVTDRQVIDQASEFHDGIEKAVIRDRELASYIQTVGDRVIDAAREAHRRGDAPKAHKAEDSEWMFSNRMQFHFVNSKTLNAFTTGGEHMYIYTELFQQCKNEDELAAVMAHEFAHVYGRHVQKGTQRNYAVIGVAVAAAGAGALVGGKDHWMEYGAAAGGAGFLIGQLGGMKFTRDDEAQADEYGFKFYTRAGWDPSRFGGFFQTMIDKGYDKGPEMLSDHPSLSSRVAASKKWAAKLTPEYAQYRKAPVADDRQFKGLQNRSVQVGRSMPTDKSMEASQELLQALPRSCLTPTVPSDQKEAGVRLQKRVEAAEAEQSRKKK